MRPLGLDGRNSSGTCPFWLYVLTLHVFMHCLSFSSLLIHILWTDLQMALAVELLVDGLSYRGFAQILYNILEELGDPTMQVEYVFHGELGPDEL